ncbi:MULTISPECIES: UDP-N-acetylmuramoyl-tripeptide--D-alanyl-D-alanine ligase [unclassified Halomonas]|uniref:UDP-N-acetylmuramoyl-tripeptide--D-alanyl-D- alanine ligase n=1 Tax=unclassified Halomonas TaxID=2609666 RepID=UPI0006DA5194|nr:MULTISPECIES: UDP-N-acetylmuramoyl-tripeptide--D-alanyl-D-alanine ligase [unclassified Halomonas]KPQ26599.1 MAG: UDP-N-acetylmuramoyl-tripeptide--D-alanyl-D-alanine ligase MurF [Halomonas sp. HL-93]SBR49601.1 UDP-N-acetylmuramoyl-tripeptide--D-alanyl-D-alanine ligase [Halomonas sp. HL-93]SNY96448.1 UDP-N-acetylmuramoyl-tripeptide--D-alanyl-D-alanine ligase [Halomonas sp. hl-4]
MDWTLGHVAAALAVEVPPALATMPIKDIVTDTRHMVVGGLFVALKGPRFDGHDLLTEAQQAGAVAALVEAPVDSALPQLVCSDTRLGLGLLAAAARQAWQGPLVAVTGNSGKTTVKDITATLLASLGPVHSTQGNLNNDIGAPLTLLALAPSHQAAVVELGANHLGEIAWTTRLAQPKVAIITNVTGAHVGEFGGMGQIAQAKGEVLGGLQADGVAVLNRDDRYFAYWTACAAPRRVISYSVEATADIYAEALSCDSQGRYAFTLNYQRRALGRVQLPLLGKHNVSNALAAAAASLSLGVSEEQVIERLACLTALPNRLSVLPGPRGAKVLNDTYNANPGAVKAALDTLVSLPGPHWCALGAMGELGSDSRELHAEIGRYAAQLGVETFLTLGEAARPASDAFDGGLHFNDHATLVRHLHNTLPPNASLLVKGSRSAGMEHVVTALRTDEIR